MRVRKLTFAALAVAAGLSLTACNDGDATAQSDPSSASSSAGGSDSGGSDSGGSEQGGEQEPVTKGSGAQGTAAGTGSDENGEAGKCRTDELEITASDSTIDGDAENSVAVTLENGGGRDCTLSEYAGVDLKTSEGEMSAKRTGQAADPVVLKDGKSVSFGISYPKNESGSGVRIKGLVVTPPNETKSVTLDWPGAASLPVTDSPGSPVKVGPIGSAGQGG